MISMHGVPEKKPNGGKSALSFATKWGRAPGHAPFPAIFDRTNNGFHHESWDFPSKKRQMMASMPESASFLRLSPCPVKPYAKFSTGKSIPFPRMGPFAEVRRVPCPVPPWPGQKIHPHGDARSVAPKVSFLVQDTGNGVVATPNNLKHNLRIFPVVKHQEFLNQDMVLFDPMSA